jgi:hypothetical protein
MKPDNIKEFNDLIKRYESITLKEIIEVWDIYESADIVANKLTGFGSLFSCTLCYATGANCGYCVYGSDFACIKHHNRKTYNAINDADTPQKLLTAFKNRAEHMRNTYPQYITK